MRVKFYTLGCKVNQYETQALMEQFLALGHQVTEQCSDLCIINTCTVTSRADRKSREAILKAKKENPEAKIAACGCLIQRNNNRIEDLGIDYLIPQDNKAGVVDAILGKSSVSKDIWSFGITKFFNHRAFVKIQDGCDNACSFCKIPHLRGRSRSR
ncbi:MAG: tRNA (N(6)-L-threonylcarbamoyladenosine(37)-C(2))-methylthiotransferase MtaB, partial [Candidatus Omnitrophota bacterium]